MANNYSVYTLDKMDNGRVIKHQHYFTNKDGEKTPWCESEFYLLNSLNLHYKGQEIHVHKKNSKSEIYGIVTVPIEGYKTKTKDDRQKSIGSINSCLANEKKKADSTNHYHKVRQ